MNNRTPKITVIIPVYNVWQYIDKCFYSVISQTIGIENIEIIVINDLTLDNSMHVVKKYKEQYPENFIIIENKKNMGPGASRNIALRKATGEYVAFLDSDDFLDENYIEYGIDKMNKYDVDVFMCQFRYFNENTNVTFTKKTTDDNYKIDDYIVQNKEIVKYPHLIFEVSACNKIYKRKKLVNNVFFSEGQFFEDMFFALKNLFSGNIYITKQVRYNYRKRVDESSTVDNSFKSIQNYYDQIQELFNVKQLLQTSPELKNMIDWFLLYSWSAFLHQLFLDKIDFDIADKRELFEQSKKLWSEIDIDNMYQQFIELHHKKQYELVFMCDNVDDASREYKNKIFLYKIYSKLVDK